MISPEQRAEIRRLFYAEHWRVGTIATTLGVHHDTVYHAIERDRFVRTGTQVRPSALDPYKAVLAATLEPYPRLRATRLYAMLRERGFAGSAVQVRRYVRTIRPAARAEAYLRLETLPGEQAQVDWGNFGAFPVGGARRILSCFVLVLSWSRAVYARFALDQTLESFLRGHVEAFTALGGVPRTLLYDNLKSVVLERVGDHIRFHPRLLELAGHYPFAPQPCAPYHGNDYSIPHTLVRRPLTLVASETAVWLLDSATEVARHPRSYAHGQRVEEPAHLARLAREKRRAHDLRGRDRLRQACPQAERFFDALAQRGAPLASQTAALLRLLDEYGTAALDAALATALARGAINTASVAHLLDQRARARRQPPPLAVVLPADPRVRHLRATPHALTAYDAF